jgi:hypothetical protein
MRLLVTIPHYFNAAAGGGHGSLESESAKRVQAVADCLATLRQQFGRPQCEIDIARRTTIPANQATAVQIDVIICTTGSAHLLDQIPLETGYFVQRTTTADPELLGFECHSVLRQHLGRYDFYCFLEDDLLVRDPWFFVKLRWFNRHFGDDAVLLPNRFELARNGIVHKTYVDGQLRADATAPFQDTRDMPILDAVPLGQEVRFVRPLNPHAGCFFLNERQMAAWSEKPFFLDRDTRFIGPLESAATLGVMKAFRVYKPSVHNAGFLEVEHSGNRFFKLIRMPEPGELNPA